MKDKIVIITGANSGIGKAATVKFAQEGYTVIMACRNLEKSLKVQQEIIEVTKNEQVDLLKVDVSSLESIRSFCTAFKEKYKKLDVLIHNAAYLNHSEKEYLLSPENVQISFATNVVGPFYMTQLLEESLQKSEDPRILHACTTNIRHFLDPKRRIEFDNLQGEFKDSRPYNVYKMYGDSKMAFWMLTMKLGEKLKDKGIKVNAIQIPAIKISKETINNFKGLWKIAAMIQNSYSALPETMADTYYHICTSEECKAVTGKLFNDVRKVMKSSHYGSGIIQDVKQFLDKDIYPRYSDDVENQDKVWELCVNVTKKFEQGK